MTAVTLASINARAATIELVDDNQKYVYRALVRPEVAKFAIEMETVLRENDHKTGWDGMDVGDLFYRIKLEFNEMKEVYDEHHSNIYTDSDGFVIGTEQERYKRYLAYVQRMREEAIDIANFCMFLCHNYPETEAEQ
jgi:hypothetical protein